MKLKFTLLAILAVIGSVGAQVDVVTLDLEAYDGGTSNGDSLSAEVGFHSGVDSAWGGMMKLSVDWNGTGVIYAPGNPPGWQTGSDLTNEINVVSNDGSFNFVNDGQEVTPSTLSFDFTGMTNGYLPSGTLFLFADVEGGHAADFTASATTPWLNLVASGDYQSPDDSSISLPTWAWNSGGYSIDGAPLAGASNFLLFETTQNLTSLDYEGFHNDMGVYGFVMYAPTAIPEPSSAILAVVAGLGFVIRRRR